MREITLVLLAGLFLSLPAPAPAAKGMPLTDAQLEDIAALPDDPEPVGDLGISELEELSIGSVAAARALDKQLAESVVMPFQLRDVNLGPASNTETGGPGRGSISNVTREITRRSTGGLF